MNLVVKDNPQLSAMLYSMPGNSEESQLKILTPLDNLKLQDIPRQYLEQIIQSP